MRAPDHLSTFTCKINTESLKNAKENYKIKKHAGFGCIITHVLHGVSLKRQQTKESNFSICLSYKDLQSRPHSTLHFFEIKYDRKIC